MAKIKKGILGPLSGKIGPITGGTWKGISYIREVSLKPKKKRTQSQIATQEKLKFINNFMVPFHSYINIGFTHQAAQKTELSAAFSINYHRAILGVYPDLSIDYSKFILSMGTLPMVTNIAMELLAPDTIKLTWSNNQTTKTTYDDQLMLVLYSPELQKTDGFAGGVKRTAEKCTFQFNPALAGKFLEVYLSITSFDRKKIADSKYLGRIMPL